MTITAEDILRRVLELGPASAYCVAFSGGPDSHVLAHALVAVRDRLPGPLRAVHVNHRLHSEAGHWAARCAAACQAMELPLVSRCVPQPPPGAGETWAREQRYNVFAGILAAGEFLLTAHHRDDQAETVLLRLLRGSGVEGLAGIPPTRELGAGQAGRPLLDIARSELSEYARENRLESITDPGNVDLVADRNFIRHRVLPLLHERWPRAETTIARAGDILREEQQFMADRAAALLPAEPGGALAWEPLLPLPAAHQRLILRQWLRRAALPVPDARQLEAGRRMLLHAGADRLPVFTWPGGCVRRYRGLLHVVGEPAGGGGVSSGRPDAGRTWSLQEDLRLTGGWLRRREGEGGLDPRRLPEEGVTIAFRHGGEQCRPAGRPRRSVKKLFQEAGVPPWERHRWPLLMVDDEIAAIPGICACEAFQAAGGGGVHVVWEPDRELPGESLVPRSRDP